MRTEKKNVFVIMPFTDEHFEVYEMLKERFEDGFEFTHAGDDVSTQQNILKDIVQMIYDADVIIADLSGLNPNVFYELGVAHAMAKKVINITQDLSQLPFDIKSYRATGYSTHFKKFDTLVKELERYLQGAVDDTIAFGNPVTDFLTTKSEEELTKSLFGKNQHEETSGEKGFIDHLADIEGKSAEITNALANLTTDMNKMSAGIENCSSEIERVQKSSGSADASFIRKQAKKAAELITIYSLSQRTHNASLLEKWPIIESSYLSLLENPHMDTPVNKDSLTTFLKSLHILQVSSSTTHLQINSFLLSFTSLRGIQSSLNQAVTSLESDVHQFLNFIEQMSASIDRMKGKSRLIVGNLDYTNVPAGDLA